MTSVVLRYPDLPGQPIVIDVPVGSYIPDIYRGATIDTGTSVEAALAEAAQTRADAAEAAETAAESFVPQFAPVDSSDSAPSVPDPAPAPDPTPTDPPAEPAPTETPSGDLDLSK